jgi:two-component system, chemotaxis family, CheB/CheR fusion protein
MLERMTGVSKKKDDATQEEQAADTGNSTGVDFPIVGIGASAGGLGALQAFFKNMPAASESDMAFVLVQHLPPSYKSNMGQLLSQYTSIPVMEIEDGMVITPNNIYIIPPNRNLALQGGRLHLSKPDLNRGVSLPIDYFLLSLARNQREHAICILLSGTGSDGTLGLKAIKGEGGMAMVQDPDSAEYDSMLRSAIATGLVDFVLPPQEMPAKLFAYVRHPYVTTPGPVSSSHQSNANTLQKIYALLRAQTGHDFAGYKQNTLGRRIERRLAVKQIERLDDYLRYLEQNPLEVKVLFREFLIGVTSFFRDGEAFAVLEEKVIPRLFAEKSPGDAVRVWVPGCSSGEEAYSLAILLQEHLDNVLKAYYQVQIFATDIDSRAIEQARSGIFSASIAADISPERLTRFLHPCWTSTATRSINKSVTCSSLPSKTLSKTHLFPGSI